MPTKTKRNPINCSIIHRMQFPVHRAFSSLCFLCYCPKANDTCGQPRHPKGLGWADCTLWPPLPWVYHIPQSSDVKCGRQDACEWAACERSLLKYRNSHDEDGNAATGQWEQIRLSTKKWKSGWQISYQQYWIPEDIKAIFSKTWEKIYFNINFNTQVFKNHTLEECKDW